jgi:hypothetical protein
LLDVARHLGGTLIHLLLQMGIERAQLGVIEPGLAADIAHAQQLIDAAFLLALKLAADRLGVHQQRIGHVLHPAPLTEQNDGVDAVGLAQVTQPAMPQRTARRVLRR